MLHCHIADCLELDVLLADLRLQSLQFAAELNDTLADIGAG